MALSRWMWRGFFLVFAAAWAWLMLVVGLLLITDWSARMPPLRGWGVVLGAVLLAGGQFVGAAMVADRLFPRADRRLSIGVEAVSGAVAMGLIAAAAAGLLG